MRIAWGIAGVVLVSACTVWFFVMPDGARSLADPDCEAEAPVMATTMLVGLREDDIATIDRAGNVRNITKDASSIEPSFSPDGTQIVYTSGIEGSYDECCGYSEQEIYVMRSDGTDKRRLMPDEEPGSDPFDHSPDWSPDGELIAFARDGVGVMTVPSAGGEPKVIHPTEPDVHAIEWSPDGERLAFMTASEDMMMIDRDGANAEMFLEGLSYRMTVSWSPDGEKLAYSIFPNVYISTIDDPNPRLFAKDAEAPAFSPDGTRIAYIWTPDGDSTPRLVTQPLDGGTREQVQLSRKRFTGFETALEWATCR